MVYYYTISKDGIAKMKKNLVKLLAVFLAGFITISGCGASDEIGRASWRERVSAVV